MTPSRPRDPADQSVLDALPFGVVVLDAAGATISANPSARRLVPDIGLPAASSCRDLFLCREQGGPCERGCIVKRAAHSPEALPEVRIDMPGGASPGALWVAAAPLRGGSGPRAVLTLRPGERGDRRRRTEARWATGPELHIHALGRTHVQSREDSLDGQWLRQRAGQVLKYLVCNRERIVLVDEIAESIWPGKGRQTVGNARYVIHGLRARLEPRRNAHDAPAFVIARGGGYVLDREHVWLDVDEFEHAIDEGRAAMVRMDPIVARGHLEHAIELYRGDFLADEPYAHWANDERIRLAGMAGYALRVATALAHEAGDTDRAIEHLGRLAELDPFDSAVHRELVAALLDVGRRGEAKRRYDAFAEQLRRDFGQEPEFDLLSLRHASAPRAGSAGAGSG